MTDRVEAWLHRELQLAAEWRDQGLDEPRQRVHHRSRIYAKLGVRSRAELSGTAR